MNYTREQCMAIFDALIADLKEWVEAREPLPFGDDTEEAL